MMLELAANSVHRPLETLDHDWDDIKAKYYGKRLDLPGELKLMEAVLYSAITERDVDWVMRRADGPFAFASVCTALGVAPAAARAALLQKFQEPRRTIVVQGKRRYSVVGKILDIPDRKFDHAYGECGYVSACRPCKDRYNFTMRKRKWQKQKEKKAAGNRSTSSGQARQQATG